MYIRRARVRASGAQPHAQPKDVFEWAWKGTGIWIGFGVTLCLKWGVKIVGYEEAEFSQIGRRKRNFGDQ